jgi:hypothetical protein
MIDPTGKVLTELRDALKDDWTDRVRGGEPAPGDSGVETDSTTGVKRFAHRFVVLVRLGFFRMRTVPLQTVTIGYRAYGFDKADAAALVGALSDAIHNKGPRENASGIAIYSSVDLGGEAHEDPVTGQPYEDGVIELIAATQVVT